MFRKIRFSLLLFVALITVSVWSTWPLVPSFHVALPTSDGHFGTVPLLNAWIVWWNAESLSRGLKDYWDAPIFYPTKGTLAFSEPQPATLVLAPLVWFANSPILAYNAYLLAALVLNGWFAARILRLLRCKPLTQLCGGVAMTLHPLALQNLEAIQLVPLWGIMWTIANLIQLLQRPTWKIGVGTGVSFATVATTSVHHALFLALLLLPSLALLALLQIVKSERVRRKWNCQRNYSLERPAATFVTLLTAALTAAFLLTPLIRPMEAIQRRYAMERSPEVVSSLSASLVSWTSAPSNSLIRNLALIKPAEPGQFPEPLLPGLLAPILAVCGLSQYRKRNRIRRIGASLLWAIALCSFLFSFGPALGWGEWNAWSWLANWLGPIARIRSPYRFAYFTQLSILLLACLAADNLLRSSSDLSLRNSKKNPWRSHLWKFASIALLLGLASENVPAQVRLVFPPPLRPADDNWVNFVAKYKSATAMLCLPTAAGTNESSQEEVALWMYYSTQHRVPLLNGYSGFTPSDWQTLELEIRRHGLADQLNRIREMGANLIVTRRDRYPMPQNARLSVIYETNQFQVWRLQ